MADVLSVPPVLEVKELRKHYPITRGLFRQVVGHVKAVDGVSLTLPKGTTLGLVGESGSGKSTLAHSLMRGLQPTSGEILFDDPVLGVVDVASIDSRQLRQVRRNMQMIFQDPNSSLNPRMTLANIIGEPLVVNAMASGQALEDRVAELLEVVGLRPEYMWRFPHAFSGGQRQRIGIARALALNPQLIIADEPTSALDVSIQAQTLNLLKDLQTRFNLSYLFISHDLGVIEHMSDRVAVMYVGQLMEAAPTQQLYNQPKHPYTEALLSSIPRRNPNKPHSRIAIRGEIANPANPPRGCLFHPRCPYAQPVCSHETPLLREVAPKHFAACHFSEVLPLRGINNGVLQPTQGSDG